MSGGGCVKILDKFRSPEALPRKKKPGIAGLFNGIHRYSVTRIRTFNDE
jgi:hypothetical protein